MGFVGPFINMSSFVHVKFFIHINCRALSVGREEDTDKTFVLVFAIVWVGGLIITFNAQFLGAKV